MDGQDPELTEYIAEAQADMRAQAAFTEAGRTAQEYERRSDVDQAPLNLDAALLEGERNGGPVALAALRLARSRGYVVPGLDRILADADFSRAGARNGVVEGMWRRSRLEDISPEELEVEARRRRNREAMVLHEGEGRISGEDIMLPRMDGDGDGRS